jgi:hypothetical protein
MNFTSKTTPFGVIGALSRSLAVRLALIPVIGLVIIKVTGSGLAGIAGAIAAALLVLAGVRIEDRRRRLRAKREHMAGLARW